MNKNKFVYAAVLAFACVTSFTACKDKSSTGIEFARNMYDPLALNPDQPVSTTNELLASFKGQTAQTPPKGTQPVGYEEYDTFGNSPEGFKAAGVSLINPLPVDTLNLAEGRHLYQVFCSPCHGDKGDGQGHLVQIDKFSGVPSYLEGASSRGGNMSDLSEGAIYHTITHGVNNMGPHSSQISPNDRWKVVMYVQQLQKGQ